MSAQPRQHDQLYADAERLLALHRCDPSGRRCDQRRCAGESWPCAAVSTARAVKAMYSTSNAVAPGRAPEPAAAQGWQLTPMALTVSPSTPLSRDVGDVMELLYRMRVVSVAQLAVRLGIARRRVGSILTALSECGWATYVPAG